MAEQAMIEEPLRMHFPFVHEALHQDGVVCNREPGETYLKNNFDLCRALDMTSMSIVLERMVQQGWLDKREAELFHMQASSLLAILRTANNRAHAARTTLTNGDTDNDDR